MQALLRSSRKVVGVPDQAGSDGYEEHSLSEIAQLLRFVFYTRSPLIVFTQQTMSPA